MVTSGIRVPPDGPETAKIMVVGEAPGADEERLGRPFVGWSGDLQARYFERNGWRRTDIYYTNLSQYRPPGNQFSSFYKYDDSTGAEEIHPKLIEGLHMLEHDIERVRPNVILALGAWPMWFLTGKAGQKNNKLAAGTGIVDRRGSVWPNIMVDGGPKVLCTLHPAFCIRQWGYTPILKFDIDRCVEESVTPDLYDQPFSFEVNPSVEVVEEYAAQEWLAFDIETDRKHVMTCIGFAKSPEEAIIFSPGNYGPARKLLESRAKKIAQNGTGYDLSWLRYHGYTVENFAFDTYVAARHLDPEFPQSLAFLTSIYTRRPYHKDQAGTDLFKYCALDNCTTFEVAMKQMKELEGLYGLQGRRE